VESLEDAIAVQNEVEYGLTAGLHSLDRFEVAAWTDAVQAGNLYVNRTITGAIVRRQPFGGWKKSAVGAGTKAGGPNYLIGLSDWVPAPATSLSRPVPAAQRIVEGAAALGLDDGGLVARGAGSDAAAWAAEFGVARDVSGLSAEKNILRYLPVPVTIRIEAFAPPEIAALLRVLAAGVTAGAPVTVSAAAPLPSGVAKLVTAAGAAYVVADPAAWAATLNSHAAPHRVRLIGDREAFTEASGGRPDIALYAQPVVEAGRIELLTFLREQAVAITAHRFGSPASLTEGLFPG
jgi:RHH-type proline utilization regulon transcriptional repressor/proline dehydrogenase/delta 1-pyrroline-5-carboxylate dehydrogenase